MSQSTYNEDEVFSAGAAIRFAIEKYNEDGGYCFMFLGLIEVVCLLAAGVVSFNSILAAQVLFQLDAPPPPESYFLAFLVVYFLLRTAAQLVINKWLLALYDGQPMSFDELFGLDFVYYLPVTLRLAGASLVFNFCALMGSLVLVGPGLFAASTLRFYKFIIVDRDADAVGGLQESWELSGAHKGQLVNLTLITGVMKLLGLCFFGIGWVPASAVAGLAETYAYKRLMQEYEHNPADQPWQHD